MNVSSGFERLSTVIRLRGGGMDGVGEDVTYEAEEHEAAWKAGPSLPLAGTWTIASFAEHVGGPRPVPRPGAGARRVPPLPALGL